MLIVGYYTIDTPYEKESINMIKSAVKFNIKTDVRGVPNCGSWQANTQFKAVFLRNILEEYKHEPYIVYLDCDATIEKYPLLFDEINGDIAVHFRNNKSLLSGTIWMNPTQTTFDLLDDWIKRNEEMKQIWDQKNLQDVLYATKDVNLVKLPPEYCFIFDSMRKECKKCKPVILHHQASRRLRNKIKPLKQYKKMFI